MSKIKFVPILLILLIWGAQTFISCATGVGEIEDKKPSSSDAQSYSCSGGSNNGSSGQSSSSRTGNSSSSVTGGSSSSGTGNISSSSSSSSETVDVPQEPVYGDDLFDSRNGQTYKTVIIGTQTWMESNLNYEPGSPSGLSKCYAQGGGGGQDDWLTSEAAKPNCDKYGRLYDWVTAMNLPAGCATASCANQVGEEHQGVCPSGWHIPSREEWNVLKNYVYDILWNNYEDEEFGWDVGTKLKAASGWKEHAEHGNGVDTYGFRAIGSGFCFSCDDDNLRIAAGGYSGIDERGNGLGETAFWWSATEYVSLLGEAKNAYRFKVSFDTNVLTEKNEYRTDLYSVRCVKN